MIGGTALDTGTPAHSFTIVMPAHLAADDERRSVLERVIGANVPAHTRWQLRLTEPGVAVGTQSTIGVDILLASHGGGALGIGTLGGSLATERLRPDALIHFPPRAHSRPSEGAPQC